MKLSISNIAWTPEEEPEIACLLQKNKVEAVEVAPSKIGNPTKLTNAEIDDYKKFWSRHGIQIVAMQSLLFGSEGMALFETTEQRENMFQYLKQVIRLGGRLGARGLVFGSPKTRRIENQAPDSIHEIALEFFDKIGTLAAQHDTVFLLEPNGAIYNCNFVISEQEAITMVAEVNNPGFSFHVDSAAIYLADESPEVLESVADKIVHVHASEPYLKPISTESEVPHTELASLLREVGYEGFVSIEMRNSPPEEARDSSIPNEKRVEKALEATRKLYFSE